MTGNYPANARIDPIDWQILAILQVEGKATSTDLGRRLGVSQTTAHDRLKKLETRGLIRGYRADVDAAALGLPVTAFIFVEVASGPRRDDLTTIFAGFRSVVECHSIAGDDTFLLKVRAADTADLERLIHDLRDVPTVARTRTVITLTTWFEARPLLAPVDDIGSILPQAGRAGGPSDDPDGDA